MVDTIYIIYDGQCPLCQFGVHHLRIRKAAGTLMLLDARTEISHPLMQEVRERNIDLDKGMLAVIGQNFYHGKDALHVLALMGTRSTVVNRVNVFLFRSRMFCTLAYPLLKLGRRIALWMKSVPLLRDAKP